MNEQRVASTVKHYLNLGTRQLDGETAARLQQARAQALSHYAERKPAFGMAWAGHSGASGRHGRSRALRLSRLRSSGGPLDGARSDLLRRPTGEPVRVRRQ